MGQIFHEAVENIQIETNTRYYNRNFFNKDTILNIEIFLQVRIKTSNLLK